MKKLISTILIAIIMLSGTVNVFAEKSNYREYNVASLPTNSVEPRNVDMNGYEYVHSYHSVNQKQEFTHIHKNPKPTTDTVTHSVTVTESTTGNLSVNALIDKVIAKVGIGVQVGYGTTKSKTTSITWELPPNSTYMLRAGSNWVKAEGTENYWSNGKIVRSKNVSVNWTKSSWSDSVAM